MAERRMTPNGFLHKSRTKAANSATAFLSQHREYLTTSELAEVTSPILAKLDNHEILPSPCLEEIRVAVLNHVLEQSTKKADAAIREPKKAKNHEATIYDEKGDVLVIIKDNGEEESLEKGFEMPQDGMRWIDRKLFDAYAGCYAILIHTNTNQEARIERDDAMARILKQGKGAICKQTSKTTSRLSFGVKAKQDHASFSRG